MTESDYIRDLRSTLKSRLDEVDRALADVDDLAAERDRLRAALTALGEPPKGASGRRPAAGGRVRRGQRKEQVLGVVAVRPGVRPSAIAKELGIASSQVHGLLRTLAEAGAVVKDGTGWTVPTAETPPSASPPKRRRRTATSEEAPAGPAEGREPAGEEAS